MTTVRTQRRRYLDVVRELAYEAAEHEAHANLTTVRHDDRVYGQRTYRGGVKFSAPIAVVRCDCGMAATAVPTIRRWRGETRIFPVWYCGICSLESLIDALARLDEYAAELAAS